MTPDEPRHQAERLEQAKVLDDCALGSRRYPRAEIHPTTELAYACEAGAAALRQPLWDCRVCGFGVLEGRALDMVRENGYHRNALGNDSPNDGTAYCPYCDDETLRCPALPAAALRQPSAREELEQLKADLDGEPWCAGCLDAFHAYIDTRLAALGKKV